MPSVPNGAATLIAASGATMIPVIVAELLDELASRIPSISTIDGLLALVSGLVTVSSDHVANCCFSDT